jgi:hypothetical protein
MDKDLVGMKVKTTAQRHVSELLDILKTSDPKTSAEANYVLGTYMAAVQQALTEDGAA